MRRKHGTWRCLPSSSRRKSRPRAPRRSKCDWMRRRRSHRQRSRRLPHPPRPRLQQTRQLPRPLRPHLQRTRRRSRTWRPSRPHLQRTRRRSRTWRPTCPLAGMPHSSRSSPPQKHARTRTRPRRRKYVRRGMALCGILKSVEAAAVLRCGVSVHAQCVSVRRRRHVCVSLRFAVAQTCAEYAQRRRACVLSGACVRSSAQGSLSANR